VRGDAYRLRAPRDVKGHERQGARSVDPEVRLGESVGRLGVVELATVDDALRVVLGLD